MMRPPQGNQKLVAIAIDKDNKGSQAALKWALETLCKKGQKIVLIHVKLRPSGSSPPSPPRLNEISGQTNAFDQLDAQTRDSLLAFRVFCTRKDIDTQEVVLEDVDVAKALIEFVKMTAIDSLVLGAAGKGHIFRLKLKDVPGSVLKGVPDFCSVYIISKGKVSTSRSASRLAPPVNSFRSQILHQSSSRSIESYDSFSSATSRESPRKSMRSPRPMYESTPPRYGDAIMRSPRPTYECTPPRYGDAIMGSTRPMYEYTPPRYGDPATMKSPFTHRKGPNGKPHEYSPAPESDITFVSAGRPSVDSLFPDTFEDPLQRLSDFSDLDTKNLGSKNLDRRSVDSDLSSYASFNNDSLMPQTMEDEHMEMQRLKQELKQTMDMYSSARKEAISAKQKALELQNWKMEEQQKLEQAKLSEKYAHVLFEQEKAKCRAAIEHAETAQRRAELESQMRVDSEIKAIKEAEERDMVLNKFSTAALGYRRYTTQEIEDATDYFSQSCKIGEGGYGPVYKCYLDHTPVAVKVLRPDAAQGISEFQQEVGVLSCIRHPNMVLLLGACPEYGCLVYEYMSCGSLEDRLIHQGKSPSLPWQHRFRIAAEITTCLLFLHHSKPGPIVHRALNLKNILLDRNLVSKISDVGLAKVVPESVADTVTQHRMTSDAGSFCYMDPEYQQTGMLTVKSDVYSLGILFLQILTSRPPMGLSHCIRKGIESGTLDQMLDPAVPDWPVEDSLCLAKLALQCCELRSTDRPDLGKVVMPELERLRALSEESKPSSSLYFGGPSTSRSRRASMSEDEFNYSSTQGHLMHDGSRNRTNRFL